MKRRLSLIVLAGLLPGCVTFKPEPINPGSTAAILERRDLNDPALRTFLEETLSRRFEAWPPKAWDFAALTGAAFFFHPSLEVARAQWQVALGGNKVAAGRLNPTVTAVPGYNISAAKGTPPWIPSLTFDIPIETAGKRGYRQARAAHLSEAARLNITAAAWQVRASLRSSLIDLISAKQREALLQKQSDVHDQIIRSYEQRLQAGAVARSELAPVRIARAKLQVDLADARRLSSEARVRVAEAIGIPARALENVELTYELSTKLPDGAALMSAEARGKALQSRADILAALAEYAASQAALQLEIAKQYPDIHLGPGYQYDGGEHKFMLGLTMELPVFNQNQGPIAEAQAHRAEVAARFNALQSKVIAELDRAAAGFRVSQENLSALEGFATVQRAQNDAIAAQIKAGAADPLDLLNSQLELGLSELAQFEGRAKAHQAYGAFEDALQLPIEAIKPASIEERHSQIVKELQP